MALSSRYTKEIQIEISGKTTALKTALDDANRAIRRSSSELKVLQNSLQLEWNPDDFKRAQELAVRVVEETRKKADALRQTLAQLDQQGEGQNTERYEAIRRELSYVEVSAQKAQKQLEALNNQQLDRIKDAVSDVADRFDKLGGSLTAQLTVPLAAAGTAAVHYASDTEEALNKVEVAFGASAGTVKDWAATTLNAFGLASGTALDMAALYGDMAVSMGQSRDEAAKMSQTLVGLAADLASFKNLSVDSAANALKGVFTGETESLKNLGVVMTQANLQAYALAKGYKTAYTEMEQAEQVTVRYQYVLDKTKDAQGDFARTSDGTANQLRIFKESLKEAAATAGNDLLPTITPLIQNLNGMVQSFSDLDDGTRRALVQTGLFAAALGPCLKLAGSVSSAISTGVTAYQALKTATTAATAAQTGLNVAMAANPVGAVATAVAALLAVIGAYGISAGLAGEHTESLSEQLDNCKRRFEETKTAISEEADQITASAAALASLAEQESRSAADKEVMLSLVKQLNTAIPNLNLSYDAMNDRLNMTAAAIRDVAKAEAERARQVAAIEQMTALYQQLYEAEQILAEAEQRMADIQSEHQALRESGRTGSKQYQQAVQDLTAEYTKAMATAEDARAAIAGMEAEIERLAAGYEAAAKSADTAAEAIQDATEAAEQSSAQLQNFRGILDSMKGGYDLLTAAQQETDEQGRISADTLITLMDKYPELTQYLTLTANGYRLTEGALADYIAVQQAEVQIALNDAQKAANALLTAEGTKVKALNLTTAAAKDQLAALAALYEAEAKEHAGTTQGFNALDRAGELRAALKELEEAERQWAAFDAVINTLHTPTVIQSSSSTAEDPRIKAYDEAIKELQYLRNMDKVSEEDYYRELEDLRDQYLEENSDKWRSVTTELYHWKQGRSQEAYHEELKDLKYFLDMGIISEQEYYQELARLRDQYLQKNSEAWRQANVQLYQYQQQCREEELKAAEEAYQEQLKAAKEAYDAKLSALKDHLSAEKDALKAEYDEKQAAARAEYETKRDAIRQELALEKERLNSIIEGIDKEIQARRELREDESLDDAVARAQKRLDAVKAELSFARTDEDRAELAKEMARAEEALKKAQQNKEDTEFYRAKEIEKEGVRDQISAAEKKAETELSKAEADYSATKDRLEKEYAAAVERLEAEYEASAARLKDEYESFKASGGSGGGGGGGGREKAKPREYSEEVHAIAKAQGVDLGVAYSMHLANQRNNAKPGDPYYYAGAELVQTAKKTQSAAEKAMKAAAAAVTAATTVNNRSANVTIQNVGKALTEGQVGRAVEKVLNKLSR